MRILVFIFSKSSTSDLGYPLTLNQALLHKWTTSFAVISNTSKEEVNFMKTKQSKKVDWKKVLNDFLLLKKAQGTSDRTISDYNKHVNIFFKRFPNALNALEVSVMEYMSEDTPLRNVIPQKKTKIRKIV